jgi:valyl-tRNA synthetase
MAKPGLSGEDEILKQSTQSTLLKVLVAVLKLTHPFLPFATEEIWHRLPGSQGSIMKAKFPEASDFAFDPQAVKEMDLLMGVVSGVRNIRGEMNIGPSKKISILIEMPDEEDANVIRRNIVHVQNMARVDSVEIGSIIPKPKASATAVFGKNQVHVLLKGLLDYDEERKRLKKEISKVEKDMGALDRKLSNQSFLSNAPPEIVDDVRKKVESLGLKLEKLNQNLSFFQSITD